MDHVMPRSLTPDSSTTNHRQDSGYISRILDRLQQTAQNYPTPFSSRRVAVIALGLASATQVAATSLAPQSATSVPATPSPTQADSALWGLTAIPGAGIFGYICWTAWKYYQRRREEPDESRSQSLQLAISCSCQDCCKDNSIRQTTRNQSRDGHINAGSGNQYNAPVTINLLAGASGPSRSISASRSRSSDDDESFSVPSEDISDVSSSEAKAVSFSHGHTTDSSSDKPNRPVESTEDNAATTTPSSESVSHSASDPMSDSNDSDGALAATNIVSDDNDVLPKIESDELTDAASLLLPDPVTRNLEKPPAPAASVEAPSNKKPQPIDVRFRQPLYDLGTGWSQLRNNGKTVGYLRRAKNKGRQQYNRHKPEEKGSKWVYVTYSGRLGHVTSKKPASASHPRRRMGQVPRSVLNSQGRRKHDR